MPSTAVAVIDIGSNSIKLLVAARRPDGSIYSLKSRTVEARISAGISRSRPVLSEEGMTRGFDAVVSLLADAQAFSPKAIVVVATSAVRDASNGGAFRERILSATGQTIQILSGQEEANGIGLGLTCDPELAAFRNFYVIDLGGGSLECLAFQERQIQQTVSLQLGCVRLTEKFVPDATQPFTAKSQADISRYTHEVLLQSGFAFTLLGQASAIGTGGTVTTARDVLGSRKEIIFEQTSSLLSLAELRELLAWLGAMPLSERKKIPGLPAARADIFPTALATLIALAEFGGLPAFYNSIYNLRWGLAAKALDGI